MLFLQYLFNDFILNSNYKFKITYNMTQSTTSITLSSTTEQNFKTLFEDKILKLNNIDIIARKEDGYINLTAMCKAGKKLISHYMENKQTKAFLQALSKSMNITISELVIIHKGGNPKLQGTWGHRRVAYHLAQWISADFAVAVSEWLEEWILIGNNNSRFEAEIMKIEACDKNDNI